MLPSWQSVEEILMFLQPRNVCVKVCLLISHKSRIFGLSVQNISHLSSVQHAETLLCTKISLGIVRRPGYRYLLVLFS